MVSSLDRDVRKFKQQSELLLLTIQAAQKREKWEKNTVIMDKGKLVFPGGGWKPDPAPAFRILSDEEMYALKQGKLQTIADVDRFRKNPDITTGEGKTLTPKAVTEGDKASNLDSAIASAKASLKSAQDSIIAAFDSIQVSGRQFADAWSKISISDIRKQVADTLGMMGSKAKQAFIDITKFFSDAVANFNKSDSGIDYVDPQLGIVRKPKRTVEGVIRDSNKAWSDAAKGFAKSQTGKDIAKAAKDIDEATKPAREFAAKMKKEVGWLSTVAMENIQDAPDATKGQVIAGVGAAMGLISGFMSAMASKVDSTQVSGEFANNAKANLIKMLNKLSSQMASSNDSGSGIPTDVLKKMVQSIKDIDTNYSKGSKEEAKAPPKSVDDVPAGTLWAKYQSKKK